MELSQLMVFVIPVFSALSRPVFLLAGRGDFVYENTRRRRGKKTEQRRKKL